MDRSKKNIMAGKGLFEIFPRLVWMKLKPGLSLKYLC